MATEVPRLSRYRSQRRAQPPTTSEQLPVIPQLPSAYTASGNHGTNSVDRTKSMSRYHKPQQQSPQAQAKQQVPASSPSHAGQIDLTRNKSVVAPRYHQRQQKYPLPQPPAPAIAPPSSYSNHSTEHGSHKSTRTRPDTQRSRIPMDQDEALDILQREAQRQHRMRQEQTDEKMSQKIESEVKQAEEDKRQREREAEEKLRRQREWEQDQVRQAAKDEVKLWADKKKTETAKKKEREKMDKIVAKATGPDESLREKFFFFRRKKTDLTPPTSASSQEDHRPKTSSGEKPIIKPGGGGIVPLSDAPVSAVNHGDRRVRVITQGKSILLPIKPNTTPLQLIRSSVTFFDVPIDPRNSLLIEDFSKVGLQRNLRMYETVRNVLNSWDSDDQHTLTLIPYDSSTSNRLFATWAPKTRPEGGKWAMYFSQKRGKWEKRIVTMTSEGQISVAKNEQGKDHTNVCHLSDFEIYSLSKEGEKKKVKPPKKYCYAIKSNQKSSMFLGDTGFIHLFCCSDQLTAENFHDTIYRWRCWYLVHVMGEDGEQKIGDNPQASSSAPLLSMTNGNASHKRHSSQASQYILGSFNTGIDFDPVSFQVREEKARKHTRMPSDTPLAAAISVPSSNGLQSASEHSKALLARQHSIRRAANNGPPPVSHSHSRTISSNIGPAPPTSSSFDAAPMTGGLQRNTSVRSIRRSLDQGGSAPLFPKPLIDLTPTYQAPVQHQRKGRAFKPAGPSSGPLIENATGIETLPGAIIIPEARNWRSRGASVTQHDKAIAAQRAVGATGGGLVRNSSVRSTKRNSGSADQGGGGRGLLGDLGMNEGFTGGGLLANVNTAGK